MNINQYLPSKKIRIVLLGILGLIIIATILYFVFSRTKNEDKNFIDVSYVDSEQSSENYIDSDNDGAYDWQEALWPELDPHNPDSDGDGVLDGKYIRAKLALMERERLGGNAPESNLSETEKFGRSTLTALMAIMQEGGGLDGATQEKFSENVKSYINDLSLSGRVYTRDELDLVETTKESSYAYRDAMISLFKKYPVAASDIELLINASENPADYQGKLRSVSKKYNEYLEELLVLPVPYVIAGRHTELINNVAQFSGAVNNFLQEEVDELISLSFIMQLEKIMNSTTESITKINLFFDIIKDQTLFN